MLVVMEIAIDVDRSFDLGVFQRVQPIDRTLKNVCLLTLAHKYLPEIETNVYSTYPIGRKIIMHKRARGKLFADKADSA
jgi:hypothetical protein